MLQQDGDAVADRVGQPGAAREQFLALAVELLCAFARGTLGVGELLVLRCDRLGARPLLLGAGLLAFRASERFLQLLVGELALRLGSLGLLLRLRRGLLRLPGLGARFLALLLGDLERFFLLLDRRQLRLR